MTTFYTPEKTSSGNHFTVRGAVTYSITETPASAVLQVTFTPQCKMLDSTYSGYKLRQESNRFAVYKRGDPYAADDYTVDLGREDQVDHVITTLSSVGTWISGVSLSGSITYSKSTGTVSHAGWFYADFDVHDGQQTVTTMDPIDSFYTDLFSIPPIYYTLSYNGNGGTGSIASSKKYHGNSITVAANSFSRANYSFWHWNTASNNSGTDYNPGSSYSANSDATLYAIWNALVKYDANGGSGAPATQTKYLGTTLTLSSTTPTRDGYSFSSWNTSSSGTGTPYQPGGSYTSDSPVTLYAIWKKKPVLTNLSAVRCDSSGNPSEDKGYVKVSASYQSDYAVSATSASVGESSASGTTYSSGTGTVEIIVGNGDLLPLSQYSVSISATSEAGTTTSSFTLPPSTVYTMPTVTLKNIRRCRNKLLTQKDALGKYLGVNVVRTVYSEESTTSGTFIRKFMGQSETTETFTDPNYTHTYTSSVYTYETLEPGKTYQNAFAATVIDKFGYRATASIDLGDDGYTYPQVASVTAYRSDTSGNPEDEGETATVSIAWSICETLSQKAPTSFSITARDMDDNLIASKSLSLFDTTSGPTTYTFVAADRQDGGSGDDMFDTDEKYVIRVEIADKFTSDYKADTLSTAYFTMDVLAGGHGVAFGKPAAREALDVGMPAYFDNALTIAEKLSLPVYEFATTPSTSDLNSVPCIAVVDTGEMYLGYEVSGTVSLMMLSGSVTGVKGNAESTYRTGDVNITPANIGAVSAVSLNRNGYSAGDYGVVYIDTELDWMGSFTVRRYSAYEMSEIRVGGYNYVGGQTGWYSPSAEIVSGVDNLTVSFGYISANKLWFAVPMGMYCGLSVSDGLASNMTYNPVDYVHIEYLSTLPGATQTTLTLRSNAKNGHTHSNYALTSHEHSNYALTSHEHNFLRAPDTRSNNQAPTWYYSNYGNKMVPEFKGRSTIGVPGSSSFVHCITINTWGDSSGGYPSQIAIGNDGYLCWRTGISGSSWDEWRTANAWRLLGTVYGQTTAYFSLTNCSELMITALRGASYFGSIVIPRQALSSSSIEAYLGGGRSGSGSGGRNAQCKVTTTYMTPLNIVIDGSTYTDNSNVWQVYGR